MILILMLQFKEVTVNIAPSLAPHPMAIAPKIPKKKSTLSRYSSVIAGGSVFHDTIMLMDQRDHLDMELKKCQTVYQNIWGKQ